MSAVSVPVVVATAAYSSLSIRFSVALLLTSQVSVLLMSCVSSGRGRWDRLPSRTGILPHRSAAAATLRASTSVRLKARRRDRTVILIDAELDEAPALAMAEQLGRLPRPRLLVKIGADELWPITPPG